jgi:outer membrane protein TolC
MIKRILIAVAFLPLLVQAQNVTTITTLFDSLKTHPQAIADSIDMMKALAGKRIANGMLYPKIDAFGTYDYSTSPTGMLPIAPNELLSMVKDQSIAQPFSQNIMRAGASVSMPIFVKSIYTMASKAKTMYKAAEAKRYINLLQNEAMIVGLNANLKYMNGIIEALDKKEKSIQKTKEIIEIKVKNERAPKIALLKIDDALNQIALAKSGLELKKSEAITLIQSLTGVYLEKEVPMTQIGTYKAGELKALDPLKEKIEAERLGMRAEREKLYPMLVARGNYNHSMADAYNNGGSVNKDYTTVGLVLKVPIFEKSQYAQVKMKKLDMSSLQNEYDKKELELSAQATQLQLNLTIIEKQIALYKQSIKDKENLLKVAATAYKSERMTVEDYLKYEDDLALEQSKYYKAEAEKWQALMKLAVIYGNNIESIVQ